MIQIVDLKIEDQSHEEQRGVLHHYMANYVTSNFVEKLRVCLNRFVYGSPSDRTFLHYTLTLSC